MYLEYFNLSEQPFSITPDPRFLYMSARHREALAHLLYGLGEGGGFVQLTGEVGTGKTTICRCLLEQVPDNVDIAVVMNPKVTAAELIATVCDELHINHPGDDASIKTLIDILNRHLLDAHARGRRTVLIIDEAQNLSADVLEQVRLLTNLETTTQKLLQVILIGQPELRDLLARENMRQLSQRITARYHLEPISRDEAGAYIRHRLKICGSSHNLFSKRAIDQIQKLTGGIPRLINVLCDRALLGSYVEGKGQVDHKVVSKASREVLAMSPGEETSHSRGPMLAVLGLLVLLLGGIAAVNEPWRSAFFPAATVVDETPVIPESASAEVIRQPAAAYATTVPETVATDEEDIESAELPAESLVDLLQQADSSFARAAWKELFTRWQIVLPDTDEMEFCDYAGEYGLRCITQKGDWDTLLRYDRPAVLALVREDGVSVPVCLQRVEGTTLELAIGSELYRLSLEQVGQFWAGDYVLFLQTPPGGRLHMKINDKNTDIAWLREQFELAQGVKIPASDPMLFDYPLQKQVLTFQRNRGLMPDGIVGRNTLIHLNTASGRMDIPRLTGG